MRLFARIYYHTSLMLSQLFQLLILLLLARKSRSILMAIIYHHPSSVMASPPSVMASLCQNIVSSTISLHYRLRYSSVAEAMRSTIILAYIAAITLLPFKSHIALGGPRSKHLNAGYHRQSEDCMAHCPGAWALTTG